eukprot:gnl/MRDRNA2_/MRDRNA2_30474_c0_seq1.p1 gnl/MRDRNA2_/MRDRNA2_30474_c0~~gnl/MRDRNA2_/MRDRNA2_30474_c0_seq1.p1  ORF type:complete len:1287 (+),score=361.65 gnl/MRDRNA2_/MRDRNA2_30474_c0_seq1:74-3934(+)
MPLPDGEAPFDEREAKLEEDAINFLWQHYDEDASGYVSVEEWTHFLREVHKREHPDEILPEGFIIEVFEMVMGGSAIEQLSESGFKANINKYWTNRTWMLKNWKPSADMGQQIVEIRSQLKEEQNLLQNESLAVLRVQKEIQTLRTDMQEVKNAEMRGNEQDEQKIQAITADMRRDLRECDEINLLEKACEAANQEREAEERTEKAIHAELNRETARRASFQDQLAVMELQRQALPNEQLEQARKLRRQSVQLQNQTAAQAAARLASLQALDAEVKAKEEALTEMQATADRTGQFQHEEVALQKKEVQELRAQEQRAQQLHQQELKAQEHARLDDAHTISSHEQAAQELLKQGAERMRARIDAAVTMEAAELRSLGDALEIVERSSQEHDVQVQEAQNEERNVYLAVERTRQEEKRTLEQVNFERKGLERRRTERENHERRMYMSRPQRIRRGGWIRRQRNLAAPNIQLLEHAVSTNEQKAEAESQAHHKVIALLHEERSSKERLEINGAKMEQRLSQKLKEAEALAARAKQEQDTASRELDGRKTGVGPEALNKLRSVLNSEASEAQLFRAAQRNAQQYEQSEVMMYNRAEAEINGVTNELRELGTVLQNEMAAGRQQHQAAMELQFKEQKLRVILNETKRMSDAEDEDWERDKPYIQNLVQEEAAEAKWQHEDARQSQEILRELSSAVQEAEQMIQSEQAIRQHAIEALEDERWIRQALSEKGADAKKRMEALIPHPAKLQMLEGRLKEAKRLARAEVAAHMHLAEALENERRLESALVDNAVETRRKLELEETSARSKADSFHDALQETKRVIAAETSVLLRTGRALAGVRNVRAQVLDQAQIIRNSLGLDLPDRQLVLEGALMEARQLAEAETAAALPLAEAVERERALRALLGEQVVEAQKHLEALVPQRARMQLLESALRGANAAAEAEAASYEDARHSQEAESAFRKRASDILDSEIHDRLHLQSEVAALKGQLGTAQDEYRSLEQGVESHMTVAQTSISLAREMQDEFSERLRDVTKEENQELIEAHAVYMDALSEAQAEAREVTRLRNAVIKHEESVTIEEGKIAAMKSELQQYQAVEAKDRRASRARLSVQAQGLIPADIMQETTRYGQAPPGPFGMAGANEGQFASGTPPVTPQRPAHPGLPHAQTLADVSLERTKPRHSAAVLAQMHQSRASIAYQSLAMSQGRSLPELSQVSGQVGMPVSQSGLRELGPGSALDPALLGSLDASDVLSQEAERLRGQIDKEQVLQTHSADERKRLQQELKDLSALSQKPKFDF